MLIATYWNSWKTKWQKYWFLCTENKLYFARRRQKKKKWKGKAEGPSQCLDQLHQYSESQCALNSQGYSIVLYKVHLGRYLGAMEKKMLNGFKLTQKCPHTIHYSTIKHSSPCPSFFFWNLWSSLFLTLSTDDRHHWILNVLHQPVTWNWYVFYTTANTPSCSCRIKPIYPADEGWENYSSPRSSWSLT